MPQFSKSRASSPKTATIATLIALTAIIVFGSMLRYLAFTGSEVPRYPNGDAAKYLLYGYNFKNFGIYSRTDMTVLPANTDLTTALEVLKPDASVTPGYPLFLSLFLGGEYTEEQRDRVLLAQVLLSSVTILLAYLAFSTMSRSLGLGVAALVALSPHLVNINLFLLTESLFCFFLILFVLLLSLLRTSTTWPLLLLIGLVFAMATLTRPWIQGYLLILIPFIVVSKARIPFRKAMLILIGAVILVAPWLVRNQITLGMATDPALSMNSIHHGMYPDMMYDGQPESLGYAYRFDPMTPEISGSSDAIIAEIKRRANVKPAEYLNWYFFGKTKSVLSWKMIAAADAVFVYRVEESPYFTRPMFYLSSYYMGKIHLPLMILALAGMLLVWLPARLQHLSEVGLFFARAMSLLLFYFLIMHIIGAPYPRYSIPVRPILYGMSLFPFLFVVQTIKHRLVTSESKN